MREIWAPRFPDEEAYMGLYEDYSHETNGILILSEDGFDRLAFGDPVPDPNIGRRIGPSTGLLINDAEGFERSGYGLLDVDGDYRVVLGHDSNRGREGLTLVLDDQGRVGLHVGDGQDRIFLGHAPAGFGMPGLEEPFQGLLIGRDGQVAHEVNVAKDN